jgi:hypothetical protein
VQTRAKQCASSLLALRCVRVAAWLLATLLVATTPQIAIGASDGALPRGELLERAIDSYRRLAGDGRVRNPVLTVIDYALPSSQRRLWVIDPTTRRVLFHEFVAHGRGSASETDPDRLVRFGNEAQSHRSSRGAFLTGDTYSGQHGHSLELYGLEAGVNDLAFERRIVIHPAHYVSAAFRAQSGGRLGRSWGCPALDPAVARPIIDRIAGGSVLFADGVAMPPRIAASPPVGAAVAGAAGLAQGR